MSNEELKARIVRGQKAQQMLALADDIGIEEAMREHFTRAMVSGFDMSEDEMTAHVIDVRLQMKVFTDTLGMIRRIAAEAQLDESGQ